MEMEQPSIFGSIKYYFFDKGKQTNIDPYISSKTNIIHEQLVNSITYH